MKRIGQFILFSIGFTLFSTFLFAQNEIKSKINNETETDSLFVNLNFDKKGICEKEFIVKYKNFGKASLHTDRRELKKVIGFIPTTSLAFSIDKRYYIPMVEDCNFYDMIEILADNELIKIKIRYYKKLKNKDKYFALILSVQRIKSCVDLDLND